MADVIGCAMLAAAVWIQLRVDLKIWGNALTPGVLLAVGYMGSASIYLAGSMVLDPFDMSFATWLVLCLAVLATTLVSALVAMLLEWRPVEFRLSPRPTPLLRFILLMLTSTYALLAIRAADVSGGLWSHTSKDALAGGIIGHLHVALAFFVLWYLAVTGDRGLLRLAIAAVAFAALSMNPVKGWIVIPLVAAAVIEGWRLGARKLVRIALAVASLGVTLFFGIYFSRAYSETAGDLDMSSTFDQILGHFVFYSTAGLTGLNAVINGLELEGGIEVLFAPLANIAHVLASEPLVNPVSTHHVPGIGDGTEGNVFSMIGSLMVYSGPVAGFFIYQAIVGVAYFLLTLAARTATGALWAGSAYMGGIMGVAWFDYYWWALTPYEVMFLSLIFAGLSFATRLLRIQSSVHASGNGRVPAGSELFGTLQ